MAARGRAQALPPNPLYTPSGNYWKGGHHSAEGGGGGEDNVRVCVCVIQRNMSRIEKKDGAKR